jgi:hypothetical protein
MLLQRALVVLALGTIGAGVSHGRVGAQTLALPTVEQVLDKYVTAVGGRPALEKVTSVSAKGTIEIVGFGVTGTIQLTQKAPDKSASTVDLAGIGVTREAFDGTTAWEESPQSGMRTKSGLELAEARRNATFPRELKLATLYPKMTVTGREPVAARDTIVIEAVPAEGPATRMFFDAESGLLVRQIMTRESPQGPIEVDATFSDFRAIDGVKRPFSIRQVTANFTAAIQLTEIKHNVAVDDGLFKR